jgi:xanthine/uracil/vitamin C permease (AzgA family)
MEEFFTRVLLAASAIVVIYLVTAAFSIANGDMTGFVAALAIFVSKERWTHESAKSI